VFKSFKTFNSVKAKAKRVYVV